MLISKFSRCLSTITKAGGKLFFHSYRKQTVNKYCTHEVSKKNGPWSVLFFGTDEFALYSLKALFNAYSQKKLFRRLEVVTNYKGEENAVIKYAKEHKLVIHSWPPKLREKEFEIGVVVSFGHLIPSKIIQLFPLGMINVHGSLLPKWRGAAPICHALMNGDVQTGVSIMKIMPKKFDIGSVIAKREIEIKPDDTYIELYNKLAELGANLLYEVMAQLPDVLNEAKSQSEEGASYAPKVTQETSFIKWNSMSAENVYNLQRALTGIQPLRAYFNNQVVKLLNVKPVPASTIVNCTQQKIPGLAIFEKKNKTLYISCQGETWMTVGTVIIPGKKPQSAADFGSGFILNQKTKSCIFS